MLELRPCDYATARDFVGLHHRHNKPPPGHKFSIACYDGDRLCGVVMVGRPVARYCDDGLTLEVNRCCTDGTRNACTILYGGRHVPQKHSDISDLSRIHARANRVQVSKHRIGHAKDVQEEHIGPENDTQNK